MPVFVWTRCFDEGEKTAFLELMITVAYTQGANAGEASRILNVRCVRTGKIETARLWRVYVDGKRIDRHHMIRHDTPLTPTIGPGPQRAVHLLPRPRALHVPQSSACLHACVWLWVGKRASLVRV